MVMERPCQLFVDRSIPPPPNKGPNTADWLPEYHGSSWLAYAAHNSIVITVAPLPFSKEEAALGQLFQQVIQIHAEGDLSQVGKEWVTNVAWAPMGTSLGLLAAAAGKSIYVFAPKGYGSVNSQRDVLESPISWEKRSMNSQDSQVLSCTWTQSGDGLLSVGYDIVMWKLTLGDLQPLWKSFVDLPHSLAATTWSIEGLAASTVSDAMAEQGSLRAHSSQHAFSSSSETENMGVKATKGIVMIWWWEESVGIEDVELSHPKPLISLQWRPLSGRLVEDQEGSGKYHRPVLLTYCKDGVIRLWLEIDIGKARADKATYAKESAGKRLKPAFFVSAVIDTNRDVPGTLNHDFFIIWALETRIRSTIGTKSEEKSNIIIAPVQSGHSQVAPCEWLVGLGPSGSVTLWSLHCLDDIYPPRCPRVMLWQQRPGLLPSICVPAADEVDRPSCLVKSKAVVNRPENGLSGPPSSIDLFENHLGGHYRWSRLWPPVSAISGGGRSNGTSLLSTSASKKSNAWGVSSELLHAYGHSGSVISVAIHPVALTGLGASLDDKGVVLLWFLTSSLGPSFDVGNSRIPVWRLSDHAKDLFLDSTVLDMLAWAPMVLPGSGAVLFVGSSTVIDCYLVSKRGNFYKEKLRTLSIVHDHLLSLTVPFSTSSDALKGVYAVAHPLPQGLGKSARGCLLVAVGQQSSVVSWNVELEIESRNRAHVSNKELDIPQNDSLRCKEKIDTESFQELRSCTMCLDEFGNEGDMVRVACNQLDSTGLNGMFETLCLGPAVTSVIYYEACGQNVSEALAQENSAYDLVTGSADGFLKFWKMHLEGLCGDQVQGKSRWECVGAVQIATNPLKLISISLGGGIVAFADSVPEVSRKIKILEVVYCTMNLEFMVSGEILIADPVTAMNWFDLGNQLLFGIACRNHVSVYAQSKVSLKDLGEPSKKFHEDNATNGWVCLASISLSFDVSRLLWSPNCSIFVASESHVSGLSQWLSITPSEITENVNKKGAFAKSQKFAMDSLEGSCILLSPSEADSHLKRVTSLRDQLLQCLFQKRRSACTLSEAAGYICCPLPGYHPRSIISFLHSGKFKQARSVLRHLGKHLLPAAHHASKREEASSERNSSLCSEHIPHMQLRDLFDLKSGITTTDSILEHQELSLNRSSHFVAQEGLSAFPKKYDFLDTKIWLDNSLNEDFHEHSRSNVYKDHGHLKISGADHFSAAEANLLINAIDHSAIIPGILTEEKSQILATIEVLAEIDNGEQSAQFTSLDWPGQRFWLYSLYVARLNARKADETRHCSEDIGESKAVAWACQSETKETLLDMCLQKKVSWPSLRALGVGFWLTDVSLLRKAVEKLARTQYLEKKDPKDCAALYLALGRQSVLSGLFKLSKDERDKPLADFLSRNFQDEKNKAAALKNAYTLMGKHRHELAVGLFLLGGDLSSACSVCVKNLCDPQLALVICRLVEGSAGPTGHNIISNFLIPGARQEGDKWLASLLQSLLQDPVGSLCELTGSERTMPVSGPLQSEQDLKDMMGDVAARSRYFLLDPDIGNYCKVLVSKVGFRAVMTDADILEIRRRACFSASFALKGIGLPLHALEQLDSCFRERPNIGSPALEDELHLLGFQQFDVFQPNSTTTMDRADSSISLALGAKIRKSLREDLALQYLAQLLLDRGDLLLKDIGTNEVAGDHLREADVQLSSDLDFLTRSFSLDLCHMTLRLAIVAQRCGSHQLSCRLAAGGVQSKGKNFLANKREALQNGNKLLHNLSREPPLILCRIVLACTRIVYSGLNETLYPILWGQLLKLIQFAKELLLLTRDSLTASNEILGEGKCSTSKIETKTDAQSVLFSIAFTCLIAAAWLGRSPEALLALVKPVSDSSQTSRNKRVMGLFSINFDVNNLDQFFSHCSNTARECANLAEKHKSRSIGRTNPTQPTKSELSCDFLWLVMGYSLWCRLLLSVKYNFNRTPLEVSYTGYGRTSHQLAAHKAIPHSATLPTSHSSLGSLSTMKESHVPDFVPNQGANSDMSSSSLKDLEGMIVNSLSCISTGLRKQMASSFRSMAQTDASYSVLGILSGHELHTDQSWKELHNLLVDWEEIESSLLFEGLDLRKTDIVSPPGLGWSIFSNELKQKLSVSPNGNGSLSTSLLSTNARITPSEGQHGSNTKSTGAESFNDNTDAKKQNNAIRFQKPEDILHLSGELFEAVCVNTCNPSQFVVASNRKGLVYFDLKTRSTFSDSSDNLWSEADWPRNGWAGSVSTPIPTFVSPGVGLGNKEGSGIGLGGATVGIGSLQRAGKDIGKGAVGFGIPGYAGMAAWGIGWEEWEDLDDFVDPPATTENVGTKAMDAHPLRPFFLVGSNNTHVYLWEFGKSSATATYGVLPAANVPPPYALASVSAVRFDRFGDRFATAALDGSLCTWQLEVGGRSNICPTESSLCFNRYASDVKFVGASGGIIAATGSSHSGENLVMWDTLAPPASSRVSVICHEGGARCLDLFDFMGSSSPLIVTGGKTGDVSVHDFRYIATGKSKRQKPSIIPGSTHEKSSSYKEHSGDNGLVWFFPKAHSASITTIRSVPGTSFFVTGSKDGDVKLWDVSRCELVSHWSKVHEKHMFLQHNARGFGAVLQAAVTAIQVVPSGFITCGGDGAVRLFQYLNPGVMAGGG